MKLTCQRFGIFIFLFALCLMTNGQAPSYYQLSHDIAALQKQLAPDKRVAIFEISLADTLNPVVVIKGETNLAEGKSKVIELLSQNHLSYIDSVRLLPDTTMGNKTWALTTLSVSNIRFSPDDTSELVSQTCMGTPLKLLDRSGNWYRIQSPDGYIGWMDGTGLKPLTTEEIQAWQHSNRIFFNKINGIVTDGTSKNARVVSDLVLGDIFETEAQTGNYLKIKMPDGRLGFVLKNQCISFDDWCRINPSADALLAVAGQMMGLPYLWGGTSVKAPDCSGFVKITYYSQGVILARDASQQARYGQIIDYTKPDNLQAGDLLFFGKSAQRITHVGIYQSNGDFIHSSGRVHISSIIPTDPKYVATRHIVAARRVLNSLNTEGIIQVKNHPWYTGQP